MPEARRIRSSVASARSHASFSPRNLAGRVESCVAPFQAERGERAVDPGEQRLHLRLDLLLRDEHVRVVLDELAHPGEPMQGTARFGAVERGELRETEGQLPVASGPGAEDEHGTGAVHRFPSERPVVGLGQEHVLAVELPVPAGLVDRLGPHLGGADLRVARLLEVLPDERFQLPQHDRAVRQDRRKARALLEEGEQFELLTERAMVASLGLRTEPKVLLQGRFRREPHSPHALQGHRGLGSFGRDSGEPEKVDALQPSGVRNVRATAQVDERSGLVVGDRLARGDLPDVAQFVGVRREQSLRLFPRDLAPAERLPGLDTLPHPGSDRVEVLRGQRSNVEIVEEALVGRWADRRAGIGDGLDHRFRDEVRSRVLEDLPPGSVLEREGGKLS